VLGGSSFIAFWDYKVIIHGSHPHDEIKRRIGHKDLNMVAEDMQRIRVTFAVSAMIGVTLQFVLSLA